MNEKDNSCSGLITVVTERIFIGIHEICDTTLQLSKGFRELGFDVTNVVVDQSHKDHLPYGREDYSPHDGYIPSSRQSNRPIYLSNLTKEFLKRAPKHDVFIFNAGSSFFGVLARRRLTRPFAYMDLPLLKKMGKKVGVVVTGSDLRSYQLLLDDLEGAGLYTHSYYISEYVESGWPINEEANEFKANRIQKHSDCVFARPMSAQYLQQHESYTVPIDPDELIFKAKADTEPLVVHAPTSTGLKGSEYVREAIEILQDQGYEFRFMMVENMLNGELRDLLTDTNIVIDQLLLPGHGTLAVEAMATGNAVLGSAVPEFNGHPEDLPVVTTTPETIVENLRYLLENPDERYKLQKEGRRYIEGHHHYKDIASDMLASLDLM